MGTEFELDGKLSRVTPVYRSGGYDLDVDGRRVEARLDPSAAEGDGCWQLEVDGVRHEVWIARHGDEIFVHHAGRTHCIGAINSLERASAEAVGAAGSGAVTAPMPGVVVEVVAPVGTHVERNALLMTIESMKLQTPILAPQDGEVLEVAFEAGQSFDKGVMLVRLGSGDEEGSQS